MFPTNGECLIGISDAFFAFCLRVSVILPTCSLYHQQKRAYSALHPQAWTYIYIQLHARRHLPSAVPWISEDRLLSHGTFAVPVVVVCSMVILSSINISLPLGVFVCRFKASLVALHCTFLILSMFFQKSALYKSLSGERTTGDCALSVASLTSSSKRELVVVFLSVKIKINKPYPPPEMWCDPNKKLRIG